MIPAQKKTWAEMLLYAYFSRSWRKAFQAIYWRGGEHLRGLPGDRPAIGFANHTNWWDILMIFRLTREARPKISYGMMEEKQLRPYRFFTWLGAFSVDLSAPGKAAGGLRYAVKLLRDPRTLLWMFPEGELRTPYEKFTMKPGLEFLTKHAPTALLLPCAFRYEFFRDDRPVVLIEIGSPLAASEASPEVMTHAVQALQDRLAVVALQRDLTGFTLLQAPQWTINKRWEYVLWLLHGRRTTFNPHN